MAQNKLEKAIKESKEAILAIKDLIVTKFKEIILEIKVAVATVLVSIYDTITDICSNISKAVKYIAYCIANHFLRLSGVLLKLPVYLLNNASTFGNILQMRANYFKTKARGVYVPVGDIIDKEVIEDDK